MDTTLKKMMIRRKAYERYRHRERPKDPEKSNSFLTIGKEYQKLDDDESAYRALQSAIRFNSDNAEAHLLLARISFREKRFRRAERHLLAAKKLDPKNSDVWTLYGMLVNRDEPGYVRNVKDSTEYLTISHPGIVVSSRALFTKSDKFSSR